MAAVSLAIRASEPPPPGPDRVKKASTGNQYITFELSCENTCNCIAASADDNPLVLSRKAAHGGVALLWKVATDCYISPLDIQCGSPSYELLFIVGVYLPSASDNLEEYCEYFDYLWAFVRFFVFK